jgi:hypothetical protein
MNVVDVVMQEESTESVPVVSVPPESEWARLRREQQPIRLVGHESDFKALEVATSRVPQTELNLLYVFDAPLRWEVMRRMTQQFLRQHTATLVPRDPGGGGCYESGNETRTVRFTTFNFLLSCMVQHDAERFPMGNNPFMICDVASACLLLTEPVAARINEWPPTMHTRGAVVFSTDFARDVPILLQSFSDLRGYSLPIRPYTLAEYPGTFFADEILQPLAWDRAFPGLAQQAAVPVE